MVKLMRRILSLILVVSLCAGMFGVAVFAEEPAAPEEPTTGTHETPSGVVISMDFTAAEGTVENPTVKTEETVVTGEGEDENKTTITTETTWKGTTTEGDNPEKMTQVEGEETHVETTTVDGLNRPINKTGTVEGEETTTVTDTTVTEKDTVTTPEEPKGGVKVETGETTPVDSETGYATGVVTEGEKKQDEVTTPVSGKADGKELEMTTGAGGTNKKLTDSEVLEVTEAELIAALGEIPTDSVEKDKDGFVVSKTTVTTETNEFGTVVGYTKVTETRTEKNVDGPTPAAEDEKFVSTSTDKADPEKPATTVDQAVVLPEKPVAAEPYTDEKTGNKITQTVTEITGEITKLDGAKETVVIGYTVTTQTTSPDGKKVLASNSETQYGTLTTVTTETYTDLKSDKYTQRVVTTTKTTLLYDIDKIQVKAEATEGSIKATMTEVKENAGHGDGDLTPVVPVISQGWDQANDLYGRDDKPNNFTGNHSNGYLYNWKGDYGPASRLNVRTVDANGGYSAHQFVIEGPNNTSFYGYCADLQTTVYSGFRYDMVNVDDATYYDQDAADHIRAIALNGYWGAAEKDLENNQSGVGSMGAFKAYLKDKGGFTDKELENLTPGMAIAATQAAIWYYGNCSKDANKKLDYNDIIGTYVGDKNSGSYLNDTMYTDENGVVHTREDLTEEIAKVLINQSQKADSSNTMLNANSITGSGIKVKNDSTESGKINTDVSFTMNVVPLASDNIMLTIKSGDKIYRTYLLAEKNSEATEKDGVLYLKADENGTYTIPDLEMASGEEITLKLTGTQVMGPGVYLYSSEVGSRIDSNGNTVTNATSQTFVGIASQLRTVDMSFGLRLDVTKPTITVTSDSENNQTRTDVDTKTFQRTDTITKFSNLNHIVTTTTVENKLSRSWSESWDNDYSYHVPGDPEDPVPHDDEYDIPDEDVPLEDLPDEDVPLADLLDEPVPLAAVPMTGDSSVIWFVIAGAAALGLAALMLLGRKREEI